MNIKRDFAENAEETLTEIEVEGENVVIKPPNADVIDRQDPEHSRTNFLADLDRATNRVEEPPS